MSNILKNFKFDGTNQKLRKNSQGSNGLIREEFVKRKII